MRFINPIFLLAWLIIIEGANASELIKCENQKECKQTEFTTQPQIIDKRDTININPYKGKFRTHQFVVKNISKIEAIADASLRKVFSRLKIDNNIDRIEVYFTDEFEKQVQSNSPAVTYTAKVDEIKRSIILFNVRYLMFDGYNLEKKFVHELTHAVLRDSMTEKYKQLPKWFKEGIAVWVANQVEEKKTYTISSHAFSNKNPLSLINGIEGEHTIRDYLEDGLFFTYIEQKYGETAVQTIMLSIIEGNAYQDAITSTLKLDWNVLKEETYEYSLTVLKKALEESGYKKYVEIKKLSKKAKPNWIEIKTNYETFIEQNPNSILVPNAIYRLGKANLDELKNYTESIKLFETILNHHSHYSLVDDSYYHLGAALTKEGRKQFTQLQTIFPTSYKKPLESWLKKK